MRFVFVALLTVSAIFAQDSKPAPKASTERQLTKEEVLTIRLSLQKVKVIQEKYKIADFQKEIQPVSDEQRSVFMAACKSVGVPEDKIFPSPTGAPGQCDFQTGFDQDDKPIAGPDGKPVKAEVKWNKPAEGSQAPTPTAKPAK